MIEDFNLSIDFAKELDSKDKLSKYRNEFIIPTTDDGEEQIYFVGNSLGLMPKQSKEDVVHELNKWGKHGVKGHGAEGAKVDSPWVRYHEPLTAPMAKLVGAKDSEVTIMNTLTVNIHFLLISFYNPDEIRNKILIEENIFPSDYFAVESQVKQRGLDPSEVIIEIPTSEDGTLDNDAIINIIHEVGDELALVFLPGVQYYSGQVLPMDEISDAAHSVGAYAGFDLAHGVGNIELELHKWDIDFSVWCTYKYLNSGPGSIAAAYIHQKYLNNTDIPRLHGWWGNKLSTRFEMENIFDRIDTADVWQVSNPPILSMAPIKASLVIFEESGGIKVLREKSIKLSKYFDYLIEEELSDYIQVITPKETEMRGCQLSLKVVSKTITGREVFTTLISRGVSCDWRYPNVIRVAPVPLYNSFLDIYRFIQILKDILKK